jgi:enoyl-CoA hydratase/carnithine racemase
MHLPVAMELAREVVANPPLSVRSTVRVRRWHMAQHTREVINMTAGEKLYLTEDFQEAARAFAEKRKPGPFKGR